MSEYSTYYNGEWTNVYDLDDCIRAIQCRNADNEKRIKYLEEENHKLKEEYNKDEEVHGWTTDRMRMKAEGCCGGRYSYKFVPTSLGVSGVIRCHCGAEFEFQEIG